MPTDISNTARQTGPETRPGSNPPVVRTQLSFGMLRTPANVVAREEPVAVLGPTPTPTPTPIKKNVQSTTTAHAVVIANNPVLNPTLQQQTKLASGLTEEEERSLLSELVDLIKRNQCSTAAMVTAAPFVTMLLNNGASGRALLLTLVVIFGMWMTSEQDQSWYSSEEKKA